MFENLRRDKNFQNQNNIFDKFDIGVKEIFKDTLKNSFSSVIEDFKKKLISKVNVKTSK